MSSSNFLAAVFLFILQCIGQGYSRTITYEIPNNDLRSHCSFTSLNGYEYDLCRLVGSVRDADVPKKIVLAELTDGTRREKGSSFDETASYTLTLGGIGNGEDADPADTPCDTKETWLCISYNAGDLRNRNGFRPTTSPLTWKESDSRISLALDYGNEFENAPELQLILSPLDRRPTAVITFSCDRVDKLDFIGVDEHRRYSFVWSTPHGCPINQVLLSGRRKRSLRALQDSEQDGGKDKNGDDKKGDDELLPSDSRKARGWIGVVVVISVLTLLCGSVLVSSARARHFIVEHFRSMIYALLPFLAEVAIKLRPIGQSIISVASKATGIFRFRRGDHDLVRWEEEDVALDSEELMLNDGPDDLDRHYYLEEVGWDIDGLNEYIPLRTTSPKYGRGRRFQSYGTTPEVDSFSDQANAMTRIGKYFKKPFRNTRTN